MKILENSHNKNTVPSDSGAEQLLLLPLSKFLHEAWRYNQSVLTSRKVGDSYRSPLWEFVRLCKGHQELRALSGENALAEVKKWLITAWGKGWGDVFPEVVSIEDAEVEFLKLWDVVRFAAGFGPLEAALSMAKGNPLQLGKPRTPGYPLFVSLAWHLQKLRGDGPILLPCRNLAALLGCSHETVAQYRQWAEKDGLIAVTKRHSYDAENKRGMCTEFRFIHEPTEE